MHLTNMYQYVSYNNTTSKLLTIKCGVTQGSVCVPLLFVIYINYLLNTYNLTLFTDDITLTFKSHNLNDL